MLRALPLCDLATVVKALNRCYWDSEAFVYVGGQVTQRYCGTR
jgi:hypothetical protein